jgi:hypothetical protein
MKTINKLVWLLLLGCTALFAQDVQTLYDQAKEALSAGKYELALSMISEAQADIQKDAQLDPNQAFSKRLLPQLEKNARHMAELAQALQELYKNSESAVSFSDLPPGPEAVREYNAQAKQASNDLAAKRDDIVSRYELAAEYRDALYKLPEYRRIEQLASVGIMDKVSVKYERMATMLIDSLSAVDHRLRALEDKLAKMMKSAKANKAQVEKMSQEVAQLSQERLNYISSITEMLAGEPSAEQQKLPIVLDGNQVEAAFKNAIRTEMGRLREIAAPVDSATYKDLQRNYDKIASYNRIFTRNKITADQAALLSQYKMALQAVKISAPTKSDYHRLLLIGGILLVVIVIVIVVATGKKRPVAPQG